MSEQRTAPLPTDAWSSQPALQESGHGQFFPFVVWSQMQWPLKSGPSELTEETEQGDREGRWVFPMGKTGELEPHERISASRSLTCTLKGEKGCGQQDFRECTCCQGDSLSPRAEGLGKGFREGGDEEGSAA